MTDYTIQTNFGAKDSLPSGNAAKVVKGSEFTTEFTNIATAVNSKADSAGDTFTGVVNFSDDIAVNTNTLFVDVSAAKVGIGTTSPANTLTVGALEASTNDQDATVGIKCNANHRGIILQENDGAEQWEIGVGESGALKFYDSGSATSTVTFQDGTGNVGIGTDSPDRQLTIANPTDSADMSFISGNAGNALIYFADTDDDNIGAIGYNHEFNFMNFRTNDLERMRIDSSGNVGIGTTSPQRALHVESEVRIQGAYPKLEFVDTDNNPDFTIIGGNEQLQFYDETNATSRMNIDTSGNVGIGTSNPQSDGNTTNLEVSSAFGSRVLVNNTDTNGRKYGIYSDNAGRFGFADYTADSTRMLIDLSGNVGIGTTSPVTKLHVKTFYGYQNSNNGAIHIQNHSVDEFGSIFHIAGTQVCDNSKYSHSGYHTANGTTASNINLTDGYILFNGNTGLTDGGTFTPTERARIAPTGSFMVGTTSDGAFNGGFSVKKGTVDYINVGHSSSVGHGNYYVAFRHGNNTIGTITQSQTSGINYNTSSDERLKENIADSADAGSRVDAIQIRQFDWKADGTHQDYGVIAQELVTVAPEAVHQPEDSEEMMGVDYSKLVPMLIKEVQSLRSRVAELESE